MVLYDLEYLKMAGAYAKKRTGCTKVSVGSCIVKDGSVVSMGANRVVGDWCKHDGCLRIAKYGDNAKTHIFLRTEGSAVADKLTILQRLDLHNVRFPAQGRNQVILLCVFHTVALAV